MYIEQVGVTWLEEKEILEVWTAIPKFLDATGKVTDTVSQKVLEDYTLERAFNKLHIKKSRLKMALETLPVK